MINIDKYIEEDISVPIKTLENLKSKNITTINIGKNYIKYQKMPKIKRFFVMFYDMTYEKLAIDDGYSSGNHQGWYSEQDTIPLMFEKWGDPGFLYPLSK